jgi:CubicO group peptidase (beta-lactamase class C family)
MRFGVRSVMKSVAAPLALLRLAQIYGPYVLTLKIGDYVPGLDRRYGTVRFIDAANMASGLGGTGSWNTHPNDINDGYLGGDYDAWYTAPSHEEKIAQINRDLNTYPWQPGTVVRYRDQDFYLLGVALDGFLKAARGTEADIWDMLRTEVFAPIGITHAPAIRTHEAHGRRGLTWFNAGYYPTLDELAKIALLYQSAGTWNSQQILHRQLTQDLLTARDALIKTGDATLETPRSDLALYKMGFHFNPYTGAVSSKRYHLPTMWGSGESEVILYPNRLISLRIGKAAQLPQGEVAYDADGPLTARVVDNLDPF